MTYQFRLAKSDAISALYQEITGWKSISVRTDHDFVNLYICTQMFPENHTPETALQAKERERENLCSNITFLRFDIYSSYL